MAAAGAARSGRRNLRMRYDIDELVRRAKRELKQEGVEDITAMTLYKRVSKVRKHQLRKVYGSRPGGSGDEGGEESAVSRSGSQT